jgi:hypothetical protein
MSYRSKSKKLAGTLAALGERHVGKKAVFGDLRVDKGHLGE